MRVSIVVAVGAAGEKEDLEKFMELIRDDFGHRCEEIATDLLGGRVQILPPEEVIGDTEVHQPPGSPS